MCISSAAHYDYTQANTKINNSHIMIDILGKTFPEHSQNVGTDLTLQEPPGNVLHTLYFSANQIQSEP